ATGSSRTRAGARGSSAAATDDPGTGWWSSIMPRIVSVWLPRWPILRFLATQARSSSAAPVDPARPFVLAADVSGTPRVTAANAAAEQDGIRMGEALADARAKAENLQVRAADPAADDAALQRLALWATRYTPAVATFDEKGGRDGLFLDVAGASHLFGGEAKLIADLAARLPPFRPPAPAPPPPPPPRAPAP